MAHQPGMRLDAKNFHDAVLVELDSPRREMLYFGRFPRALAFGEQLQHFALASR
jgi:hypothetical protein